MKKQICFILIFVILHIKQNKKIARLMKRYEKFMKGKNAEKNESVAKKVNLQWIYVYLMENDGFLWGDNP